MKHLPPRITIFLLIAIVIQVCFLYWFSTNVLFTKNIDMTNFSGSFDKGAVNRFYTDWQQRMREIGTEKAYQEFKQYPVEQLSLNSHFASHLFGELIYKEEGSSGLKICDNTNAYGCFHGFMTRAISEKGPPVLYELNEQCIYHFGSMDTGCRHGIGHGVFEYYGNLEKSLTACAAIRPPKILGCSQGVFMEFNFPSMTTSRVVKSAKDRIKNQNIYYPCNAVDVSFRPSCYFELVELWDGILDKDYKKIIILCQQLANPDERNACFLGIGRGVSEMNNFDTDVILNTCGDIQSPTEQNMCKAGAFWFFTAIKQPENAAKICSANDECITSVSLIQ